MNLGLEISTRLLFVTPRLQTCLEAGDAGKLLPVLARWSEDELERLHLELHFAYEWALALIDEAHRLARDGKYSKRELARIETDYTDTVRELKHTFAEVHQTVVFLLPTDPHERVQ